VPALQKTLVLALGLLVLEGHNIKSALRMGPVPKLEAVMMGVEEVGEVEVEVQVTLSVPLLLTL
jgi:hypothetical protein